MKDAMPMMMDEESGADKGFQKHEIESAAEAVLRAEEIKHDPKLWPHVQKHLNHKKEAINKITSIKELKSVAKKKIAELDKED